MLWLLGAGLFDPAVPSDVWSGLPLTVLIASFALVLGFPLGILLALGRVSGLPFFRTVCTGFIELLRGLPLVSVLFMASVMVPLLVPAGVTPGKLLRAYLAFMLVAAAFIAEVDPRRAAGGGAGPGGGGDRARPRLLAHHAAASCCRNACACRYRRWSASPSASSRTPSLVTVIGLTDFLGAVGAAARDPAWLGHDVEGYAFAALVYFTVLLHRLPLRRLVGAPHAHRRPRPRAGHRCTLPPASPFQSEASTA